MSWQLPPEVLKREDALHNWNAVCRRPPPPAGPRRGRGVARTEPGGAPALQTYSVEVRSVGRNLEPMRSGSNHPAIGRLRGTALLAMTLLLTGCVMSTQTPYQPLQQNGGFSEQRIETNRYRVTFAGNSLTTREEVENNLLFRIAELTLSQGYDYFVLSDNDTEANTSYMETLSGYDSFDPFFPRFWPRTTFASGSAIPITNYKAQAYVLMFKGTKPDADVNAYAAHEVQTSLAPSIRHPLPTPR